MEDLSAATCLTASLSHFEVAWWHGRGILAIRAHMGVGRVDRRESVQNCEHMARVSLDQVANHRVA